MDNAVVLLVMSGVSTLVLSCVQCLFLIRFTGIVSYIWHYIIFAAFSLLNSWLFDFVLSFFWDFLPWQLRQPLNSLIGLLCFVLLTRFVLRQTYLISVIASLFVILVNVLIDSFASPSIFLLTCIPVISFWIPLLSCFFIIPTYFLLQYFVKRYRIPLFSASRSRHLLLVLSPLLFIILLMQSLLDKSIIIQDNVLFFSYTENGPLWGVIRAYVFSILACVCTYGCLFAYQKLTESFDAERKTLLLEQQLTVQKVYTKEAKARYDCTRSFRHDLKNHVLVLRGLLEQENVPAAMEYLNHFEVVSAQLTFSVQTGNPAVDVLCSEKLAAARQNGIAVTCDVAIPSDLGIPDFDLCVVFANAIDNAIHACNRMTTGEPWIDLKAKCSNGFFLIDVVNTYEKSEAKREGLGLMNIQTVTEKHGGAMQISQQDGTFILTVLFTRKAGSVD